MLSWFRKKISSHANVELEAEQPLQQSNQSPHSYNSDLPITSRVEDRFNRALFSTRIAETIASRTDTSTIVLGLYGAWGDGKTSVLEMMRETLIAQPNVIVVQFNPWHFHSEEQLLRGYFATLAEALGKSLPKFKEKIGTLFKKYGALLSLGSLSIAGLQINPGEAAKGMGESLSTVELEDLKKRIEDILDASGKRIVVFIDDIDRLDRDETHAIFKLVKLSGSFRNISYVLAFDDAVVSAALGTRYGDGGSAAGRAFLEKIIQVPLHLPHADSLSLRKMAFEGVDLALSQSGLELKQEQIDTFVRHFIDGLSPRIKTPRLAKLYSNALTFALPLLKGEVDPVDMMLIEGIRVLYPALYSEIRQNEDLFLKGMQSSTASFNQDQQPNQIDSLLSRALPDLNTEERRQILKGILEPLFPRIKNVTYGNDWDSIWNTKQKICSRQYFKRYFAYAIPEGDIPDSLIQDILERLAILNPEETSHLLQDVSARNSIPQLISKLRIKEDSIDEAYAEPLIIALASNSNLLPRERGPMSIGGTWAQGAILVSQLMKKIPSMDTRQQIALAIATRSQTLGFGFECLRWIRHSHDEPEELRVLSIDGESAFKNSLANRIEQADGQAPLYLTDAKDAPGLYWLWTEQLGAELLRSRLIARFEQTPNELNDFLDCYVGEAWGLESGLPRKADFSRDSYDAVSKLIDPKVIASCLYNIYGNELDNPIFHPSDDWDSSRRIAHQFMYIHQHAESTKSTNQNGT